MLIHICIRQTLEWQNEALVRERLIPNVRPKVEVWNATFTMPYHLFRHRLKEIAQLNLGRVEGAACSATDEVPPGHVIVPVDDDDWLAPDLANRLRREHDPGVRGYLWQRDVLELPPRLRTGLGWLLARLGLHKPHDPFTCKTNNYAITNEPELLGLLPRHRRASEYFDTHPSDVKRIPATLAIQNRNLGSRTMLARMGPSISRDDLVTNLHRYRNLYSRSRLRAELGWAKPYVDLMAELMQEVRVK